MDAADIQALVAEVDLVFDGPMTWKPEEIDDAEAAKHDPVTFIGAGSGWRVVAVSFSIEDQGFPPGSRGYDGTASKDLTLVRLTRPQAERAFKLAVGSMPEA